MFKNTRVTFLCITVLLFVCVNAEAQSDFTKTVSFNFDKNDFVFQEDSLGNVLITSDSVVVTYSNERNAPAIPFLSYYVLIGPKDEFVSFTSSNSGVTINSNITMAVAPSLITTDAKNTNVGINNTAVSNSVFPTKKVEYVKSMTIGGYKLLNFIISPYKYIGKRLYFYKKTNITLMLRRSESDDFVNVSEDWTQRVKDMAINGSELEDMYAQDIYFSRNAVESIQHPYDYVIITSQQLKNAFVPLVEWKNEKGIRAKIVTTDSIYARFPYETSSPLAIKKYIKFLKDNEAVKYILLGGDTTHIPVQYCYGSYKSNTHTINSNDLPTDMFYACTDSVNFAFNWDGNQNGIVGEPNDSINLAPELALTRIPAMTIDDANAYIAKILQYEKFPSVNNWRNSILMCGTQTDYNNSAQNPCDTQLKGAALYSEYIQPYWNGSLKRFYSTGTDFAGGAGYALNRENLQHQLSQGYAFMDMMTHGFSGGWSLENGAYFSTDADSLNNSSHTIITTTACDTNSFDDEDFGTALSRCFINNPNSGIIAYLGSSRKAFDYSGYSNLGPSSYLNACFYKHLFKEEETVNHFGTLVNYAKQDCMKEFAKYTESRWIVYAINPIGDPEMPIYTNTPLTLNNVYLEFSNGYLSLRTPVDGAKVCIQSLGDKGNSYHHVFDARTMGELYSVAIPSNVSICISKTGYIPYRMYYATGNMVYIQNTVFDTQGVIKGGNVEIGKHVTDDLPYGQVIIEKGETSVTASNSIIIDKGFEVKLGASFSVSIE